MNEPIAIISTDWHIKSSNQEVILSLIDQQIELAETLGVQEHICLGDVFESRQAQPLNSLKTFEYVLDKFVKAGHALTVIPGNHDKTNYESFDSFLDPFFLSSGMILVKQAEYLNICGTKAIFIPFFTDEIWLEEFNRIKGEIDLKDTILFSHRAFNGSVNNDGSKVEQSISPKIVSEFKKVFLGHYHDRQQIGDNIFHLPSIQQTNFGENIQKGFTVLYEDGSHELVKANFKEYQTVKINLNEITKKEINGLKKKYSNDENYIRFKFTGNVEKVKSISKDEFESLGIRVDIQEDDIEFDDNIEVRRFTADNIVSEFKEWCEREEKDYEVGINYINQKLR